MEGAKFEDIYVRIAEAINSTRSKDLADFLGISDQAVSKALKRRKIPQGWLQTISTKTNLSLKWLLFGDGPEGQAAPCLQVSPATCPRCMELYDKLVQVQERENALLKENHALKAENMCLQDRRSLSAIANGESQQASTA